MQAPILLFDHTTKTVATIQTGPGADKRLQEVLASQQKQVATSGLPGN